MQQSLQPYQPCPAVYICVYAHWNIKGGGGNLKNLNGSFFLIYLCSPFFFQQGVVDLEKAPSAMMYNNASEDLCVIMRKHYILFFHNNYIGDNPHY